MEVEDQKITIHLFEDEWHRSNIVTYADALV